MSGSNPFRHKKAASTAGPVATRDSTFLADPGSRRHRQEQQHQARDGEDRRPGAAEEWLASIDTAAAAKQTEDQVQDEGRQLFERVTKDEDHHSRPVANSKTVRIASPPARQIPSPDGDDGDDDNDDTQENIPDYTTFESAIAQTPMYRVSTPEVVEDPFNAAGGAYGSSDDDDYDGEGDRDDNESDVGNTNPPPKYGETGNISRLDPSIAAAFRGSYEDDLWQSPEQSQSDTAKANRTTMDVDAFKRLLLTGNTEIENTYDSRDLDLHSLSRQYQSDSQEGNGSQAQSASSSIYNQQRASKLPPPPPKTRRGKAVSRSSDDFTDTHSKPAEAPVSPSTSIRATYTRSPASSIHGVPPPAYPFSRRSEAQSESSFSSHAQFKRPPTPPLARRHSQMRRGNARDPARLSPPSSSTKPLNRSASLNSAFNPKTPPPPPTRRTEAFTATDQCSTTSSVPDIFPFEPPKSPAQHQSVSSSNADKASMFLPALSSKPLPPPPRRTGASNSTTHPADTHSVRRPSSILAEVEDHQPPPPPPQRKSSKSSNTGEPITSTPSNANDILASLSQLQQDLDKFRGRYGGAERGFGRGE